MNSPIGQRFLAFTPERSPSFSPSSSSAASPHAKALNPSTRSPFTASTSSAIPHGTLRTVISNQASLPGIIIRGKEFPHPDRRAAGMIFFNNEGSETGGLIYGSFLDKNGKLEEATVHLSFDQYMQDQVFTVEAGESNGKRSSFLRINDVGDYSILENRHPRQRTYLPTTADTTGSRMAEVSYRTPRRRTPRPARSHQRPLLHASTQRHRGPQSHCPPGNSRRNPKDSTPRRHRKSHKGDHYRAMTPKQNRTGIRSPCDQDHSTKVFAGRSTLSYLSVFHT